MTAWLILAGLAVVIVGVVAKVVADAVRDLREDRARHGGRISVAAARRAWLVIGATLLLVLLLVVLPLLAANTD